MRSSFFTAAMLLATCSTAQIFSADSRPYRYMIDRNDSCEGRSSALAFEIRPHRTMVQESMERSLVQWYDESGNNIHDGESFKDSLNGSNNLFRNLAIKEVALVLLLRGRPAVRPGLIKKSLIIDIGGFEPVTLLLSRNSTRRILHDSLQPVISLIRVELNNRDNFEMLEMTVNFEESMPGIHYTHPDEGKIDPVRISTYVSFEE